MFSGCLRMKRSESRGEKTFETPQHEIDKEMEIRPALPVGVESAVVPTSVRQEVDTSQDREACSVGLDCYPYTFSPLLLFAQGDYFDKGHSNYNSVAQFFTPVLMPMEVDMLRNVLYDRKNMLYEELLEVVVSRKMLVTCCIDAHFTAMQVLPGPACVYYDPLQAGLTYLSGDSFTKFAIFLLLKCSYANNQHVQENKDHYVGRDSNSTRRIIYKMWENINKIDSPVQLSVSSKQLPLNLDRYLLINSERDPRLMSTQLTGNTCYFQTYLFGLLCEVCGLTLAPDRSSIELQNIDKLDEVTVAISRFMLEFFVQEDKTTPGSLIMRPLTNSNFVLDFHRYKEAKYYTAITQYLRRRRLDGPNYERQYERVMDFFWKQKVLHKYGKMNLSGTMAATLNTKSLQAVHDTEDEPYKLGMCNYYKYRAGNLMFGFNTGICHKLTCFAEFNSLRKNQLLAFYTSIIPFIRECPVPPSNKYRDYYFMAQFEIGQKELVDLHHYTYQIDLHAMLVQSSSSKGDRAALTRCIHRINELLVQKTYFSTSREANYDKFLSVEDLQRTRTYNTFLDVFMSPEFFSDFAGLGVPDLDPRIKDINSLTQTAFYSTRFMERQQNRMEFEFEKELINNMSRSTLRKYMHRFDSSQDLDQTYEVEVKIGYGFTYSKYNTLMHFLNVVEAYWHNPDLHSLQVFGKDIRALLAVACQKIFFEEGHNYYHYGPLEVKSGGTEMDLQVANGTDEVHPYVSRKKRSNVHSVIVTDRVYEYHYLQGILEKMFERSQGVRIKTDNPIINLNLLSLLLDFGLYEKYAGVLNLPFLQSLRPGNLSDKLKLQVEISNLINDFDKKNNSSAVTRMKVEELIFSASYKFIINKNFSVRSREWQLINELNGDPMYQQYLMLCKLYVSLCQINKSVEVDYYKIRCNNDFKIIIPQKFSKATSEYLEQLTRRYTFLERDGFIEYDELRLFDLRAPQPEVELYKVRFASSTRVESMVKYIEFSNVFRGEEYPGRYMVFISDNVLLVEERESGEVSIRINDISLEIVTMFFNEAISFVPCFKYADSEDVILFTSPHIHYLVDQGGQFNANYFGMKHELMECILSDEAFVDLNDEHVFKSFKLCELVTESKTILYFPDYLLQVQSRQQLINLLDLSIYIRNISFFVLVLFYLSRASVNLEYVEREKKVVKITGPWRDAIAYVLNKLPNADYDRIFQKQFFDLNSCRDLSLDDFVEKLCTNFSKYQRFTDGQYQIVPRDSQKAFLKRIIRAEECFHFSEVGSGKTKVILPLLCQIFLSNNTEAHKYLSRGGQMKQTLVIVVPEHLVPDACAQVYRYCLNLNFREEYRVYSDIFALLHDHVQVGAPSRYSSRPQMKQIFITSFNLFKKALTYDSICRKVRPDRDRILVLCDEVDDFLDRDKLVFNICSNMNNSFRESTLDHYFEVSHAVYSGKSFPSDSGGFAKAANVPYWEQLHEKFNVIHAEIQEKSKSINKAFGIFNEETLRHCQTNIAHDIQGYKSLIARPYESVNRAMPGSYYSDVERTIYLTYYILMEDTGKYDELFQEERKFITFEYFNTRVCQRGGIESDMSMPQTPQSQSDSRRNSFNRQVSEETFKRQTSEGALDYDDLVYGNDSLSRLVVKHPETKDGLTRFLYEIILRRMEIRDRSRSVNSIDVVFNFDCIGFTGTPFIDNYPTFSYINKQREDEIPDLIDRSFYAYTSDKLSKEEFEDRFTRFQAKNNNVLIRYVSSDFMQDATDEMTILSDIFTREARVQGAAGREGADVPGDFNVIVDLCGIFKKSTIHEVRDLVLRHFGPDRFHYLYHINPIDGSDRVLYLNSDNDVQFDEEFYKYLCKKYGAKLREKIFFFVDNRNVIGKDVPFQLVYHSHFRQPLFFKSVVLAHDVDDFSKIWQAMGRSRTMNDTLFTVYKSAMDIEAGASTTWEDIKKQEYTRMLYVRNCDQKMAGNLSSIYQTLISLFNHSNDSFYYVDEIVNIFLEKMENTIADKVKQHRTNIARKVLSGRVSAGILTHILGDKFQKASNQKVVAASLTKEVVQTLVLHIVQQKYEQRSPSGDIYDEFIRFLSGEQESLMEISYTKQQQKQKEKQSQKNQDNDTMAIFDRKQQMALNVSTPNYFQYTLTPHADLTKIRFGLPLAAPILKIAYGLDGRTCHINVYPTLQFLYSHYIIPDYISRDVHQILSSYVTQDQFVKQFLGAVDSMTNEDERSQGGAFEQLDFNVTLNYIKQNPQYTMAAIRKGVYVIGMKDQFNTHDLTSHPLRENIQYISDEMGFILYDGTGRQIASNGSDAVAQGRSIEDFGPYYVEQYILMEVLSKQEVAQNVLDYYTRCKDKLQRAVQKYSELQGKGFICWRFIESTGKQRN